MLDKGEEITDLSSDKLSEWKKKRRSTMVGYIIIGSVVGIDYSVILSTVVFCYPIRAAEKKILSSFSIFEYWKMGYPRFPIPKYIRLQNGKFEQEFLQANIRIDQPIQNS